MAFRQFVGNLVDKAATTARKTSIGGINPFQRDFGISEFLAGGNTTNTGSVPKVSNPFANLAQSNVQRQSAAASGPTITDPLNTTTNPSVSNPTAPSTSRNSLVRTAAPQTVSQTAPQDVFSAPPPQSAPQAPSLGFFQGREYFDPSELYNDQLSYLESIYGSNLATLRKQKQSQLDTYGRQRGDIQNSLAELLRGYDTQEQQGLGNIANYYSNLGDLYQSSQGTRENDYRGEVETARTKTRGQANENISALERAIAEFLDGYNQQEAGLAREYTGSRDEIGNSVVGDLEKRLSIRDLAGRGVETDLTPAELSNNEALIGNLNSLRTSRLGSQPRNGTQLNTNAILQYLAGLV